jgi:hypothetical protein
MSRSSVKSSAALTTAAIAAVTLLLTTSANAQVNVAVFSGYNDNGSDITFSGPVSSFTSPDIAFATNTGYNWHPFSLGTFGAEMTGCLSFPTDGVYTLNLGSDDGSYLFLNGSSTAFINNGGGHGPNLVSNSAFFAGGAPVPFRLVFFEDFGGPSGVDLLVNGSLAPASVFVCDTIVPEPGEWAFAAVAGTSLLGLIARRRKY